MPTLKAAVGGTPFLCSAALQVPALKYGASWGFL